MLFSYETGEIEADIYVCIEVHGIHGSTGVKKE